MTNVQAAIICGQLDRHSQIIDARKRVFALYSELLGDVPGISMQPYAEWADPTPWLFSILVKQADYGMSRDELALVLDKHGIETRPFFVPLHRLPPYRERSMQRKEYLPCTDQLASEGMNLPTFNKLSDEQITVISEIIRSHKQ